MATTNIAGVKKINGELLKETDITVGLRVTKPNGLGGAFEYECTSVNKSQAHFKNTAEDWEGWDLVIEFDQPDFSLEDFKALESALKVNLANKAEMGVIHRANQLGYARSQSSTQHYWTDAGILAYAKSHPVFTH